MQDLDLDGQMTTSHEGSYIDSLTTTYGFHQLISDLTYLLPNSSSCIDLIFTDQPDLAVDSGFIQLFMAIAIIKLFLVNSI